MLLGLDIERAIVSRVEISVSTRMPRDFFLHDPHVVLCERIGSELVFQLLGYMAGMQEEREVARPPQDWWQAFRLRWFPDWWLRRYPVKRTSIIAKATMLLPNFPEPLQEKYQPIYYTVERSM